MSDWSPPWWRRLHQSLSDKAQSQEIAGEPAVLLVAPQVRPWMARMMKNIRNLHVLAYNEVPGRQAHPDDCVP